MTPRLVALITHRIMLRRRVWAYSRRLSAQTVSGRCPGGARKASGSRPGGVREVPGKRPKGVREVPGRLPKGVREPSGRRPKRCRRKARLDVFGLRRPAARKFAKKWRFRAKLSDFSMRLVKLPPVFCDFDEQRLFCTGAMVFNGFSRLFKNTAPVQKVRFHRACAQKISV